MKLFQNIDKKHVSNHVIFWLIWVCSFTVIQSFGYGIYFYFAWLSYYLLTLPLFVVHTYLIAYWLVPKYFFRHRYLVFSALVFILMLLASVVELVLSNELIWRLLMPGFVQSGNYLNFLNIVINGLGNEYIVLVFLSVKVVRLWYSKSGEKTELLNRKLSAEIALLQYQSYPRFVLNAMDRLELLAMARSGKTPEMIIRFSDMMNQITSLQKEKKTTLRKEIEMIGNYIEIQRASFPEGFEVNFRVTGGTGYFRIPPFLFFQLVEEGFRILDDCCEKADFSIRIHSETASALFSMHIGNEMPFRKDFDKNVIENARKYLDYFYPENYTLKSDIERNFVKLSIEING